jgi:catechol 2,3-dioxygenase-like lactoylglutathione lyase family enzyme
MPAEATSAVHLDQIGQIAITVSDLARSQQFYQHTLGMKLLFNAGNMAFFQCGSVRLMLGRGAVQYARLWSALVSANSDRRARYTRI